MKLRIALLGVATASLALLGSDYAQASEGPMAFSLDPQPSGVYGGETTDTCEWPTTAFLGGCTGTLVHPRVVIYAAHCGGNIGQIRFGENGNSPTKTVFTDFCQTYPGGGPGAGNDWAFCVLSEEVDYPIVPPLMGCETSVLQPGKEVAIVGYGNNNNGNPFGVKHEVYTTINQITPQDEAYIGGGGKDSCQGDSGGPVYIKLDSGSGGDDSWRVFGITSYGGACGGGGYYSMMHTGMQWFEEQSGYDLTPCHDADGTWNPSPKCGMMPMTPEAADGGTWANNCPEPNLSGWSTICGDNPNNVPDDTPPTVEVTFPIAGTQYDIEDGESNYPMTITAVADDVGWGVKEVRLVVNGEEVPNGADNLAPYEWNVQFPAGQYFISAIAEDWAGNSAMADEVPIGVNMPAPAPNPDPTTSGTDSGTGTGSTDGGSETDPTGVGTDDTIDPSAGSGTEGSSGGETGEGDKGCACTTGDSELPLGLAVFGLGLLAIGRRRR